MFQFYFSFISDVTTALSESMADCLQCTNPANWDADYLRQNGDKIILMSIYNVGLLQWKGVVVARTVDLDQRRYPTSGPVHTEMGDCFGVYFRVPGIKFYLGM